MRTSEETKDITLLGQKNVKYEFNYRPDVLETFDNKHPDHDYWVKFNCPEFTTLCPITGQPDFGTIYISYIPDEKIQKGEEVISRIIKPLVKYKGEQIQAAQVDVSIAI